MRRLPRFDLFRAGVVGGTPLGPFLERIEARDHRAAKLAAETAHGIGAVVVLPAGRSAPPTSPAPTPPRRNRPADRIPRGAHPRSTHPRTRP